MNLTTTMIEIRSAGGVAAAAENSHITRWLYGALLNGRPADLAVTLHGEPLRLIYQPPTADDCHALHIRRNVPALDVGAGPGAAAVRDVRAAVQFATAARYLVPPTLARVSVSAEVRGWSTDDDRFYAWRALRWRGRGPANGAPLAD